MTFSERVNNFLSDNTKFAKLFFGAFCIVAIILSISLWAKISYSSIGLLFCICFSGLCVFIAALTAVLFFNYKKFSLLKIFVVLFTVFGLLYFVMLPMFTIEDEPLHFYRILQITDGNIRAESMADKVGGYLPSGIPDEFVIADTKSVSGFLNLFNYSLDYKNLTWKTFANTAVYSPPSYLPQLAAIMIVSQITDKAFVIAYAGRFAMFIVSLLVLAFCIKKSPIKNKTLILLALTPMFMQEAISLSADPFVNILSFLIAVLVFMYIPKQNLRTKDIVILSVVALIIASGKMSYQPLVLLFFLIPKENFPSVKFRNIFLTIVVLATAIITLGWLSVAMSFANNHVYSEEAGGATSIDRIVFILKHPFEYLTILIRTIFTGAGEDLMSTNLAIIPDINRYTGYLDLFMGAHLAWFKMSVNKIILYIYFITIVLMALSEKWNFEDGKNYRWQRVFMVIIGLAMIAVIFTSVYALYGLNSENRILGVVQGRYFAPSVLLFFMALNSSRVKLNSDTMFKYCLPIISITHLFVFYAIFSYYGWAKGS
jgi:uncharacterized membrane protein